VLAVCKFIGYPGIGPSTDDCGGVVFCSNLVTS
jgi:hypothetical protein